MCIYVYVYTYRSPAHKSTGHLCRDALSCRVLLLLHLLLLLLISWLDGWGCPRHSATFMRSVRDYYYSYLFVLFRPGRQIFSDVGLEQVCHVTCLKIHQGGVQWKQGAVVYIILYTSLLCNTTPIHGTPL